MPTAALEFLNTNFEKRSRNHYYLDESESRTTLEAKFKLDSRWYSVEFDRAGNWLDTEFEVSLDEVPPSVWQEVCTDWSDRYGKFRVARVQQHIGKHDGRYFEVELRARKAYEWERYEAAIDSSGAVLTFDTIKLAPGHLDRW